MQLNLFADILAKARSGSSNSFKLRNHILFIPYQEKKYSEIRVHSFDHSRNHTHYFYRLHITKMTKQSKIPKSLKNIWSGFLLIAQIIYL